MNIYKLAAILGLLVAGSADAAVWNRPSAAYTPTNNSLNVTKYQNDRANGIPISSVKLDGDINAAFQGLNDIEARTAPTVNGQIGKFLTTDGVSSFWSLVPPTSISSTGITSGYVLKANGGGTTSYGLLDASSFPDYGVAGTFAGSALTFNSAGQVISVTVPNLISETNITVSNSLTVSGSTLLSGSTVISGSIVFTPSTTLTAPFASGLAKAWVNFDGSGANNTNQTIRDSYGVSSVYKVAGGTYNVTFTRAMNNANYVLMGSVITTSPNVGYVGLASPVSMSTQNVNVFTRDGSGTADGKYVNVVFFGN